MLILIGEQVAECVRAEIDRQNFGLFIDDVADIKNTTELLHFFSIFQQEDKCSPNQIPLLKMF